MERDHLIQFVSALPPHLHARYPELLDLWRTLNSHANAYHDFTSSTDPTVLKLRDLYAELTASKSNLAVMKTLRKKAIPELVDDPRVPLSMRFNAARYWIDYSTAMYFYLPTISIHIFSKSSPSSPPTSLSFPQGPHLPCRLLLTVVTLLLYASYP